MKRKTIGFAYPTSPAACQFGHAKTGCFTVDISEQNTAGIFQPGKTRTAFETVAEARAFAETLPYPWGKYTI